MQAAFMMSRKAHSARTPTSAAFHGPDRPREPVDGVAGSPAAYAFFVRMWRESRDYPAAQSTWRGTVSDLEGHHLGSFNSILEIPEILARATGSSELLLRLRHHADKP